MRILVTGATGYVGSRLVAALLEHGHDEVVACRDPEKLALVHCIGLPDVRAADNRAAAPVTPSVARPALGLFSAVPKPVAGVVRSGLDLDTALPPKVGPS